MQKILIALKLGSSIAMLVLMFGFYPAHAGEGEGYYDFGVFDYEEGKYERAEKNFIEALKVEPDNPFYNHYHTIL